MKNAISQNGRGLWVVEFSQRQQNFHIDTLRTSLSNNRDMFFNAAGNDFLPLGIFRTSDEASAFVEALDQRENRSKPFTDEERQKVAEALRKRKTERNLPAESMAINE